MFSRFLIYRAAKVQYFCECCKRLRAFLRKKSFLYVVQHKIGACYCAREKKIVPLQTAFGVEFVRLKATIVNNHRKTT